jgi:4-carboxymuconolactone decarboxylase
VIELTRPRIAPAEDLSAEQRELLSKSWHHNGAPLHAAATLANHPLLLRRFMLFAGVFLSHSRLPQRDRELMTLRAVHLCGVDYYFAHHIEPATAAGLTRDEIVGVTRHGDSWPQRDELLLTVVDEIVSSMALSDATWARLAAVYDNAQLEEILLLPGFYRMLAGFVNTIGIELEPGLQSLADLEAEGVPS